MHALQELNRTLSSFARDYDGMFSSGGDIPPKGKTYRNYFSATAIDADVIQWQFNLITVFPNFFNMVHEDSITAFANGIVDYEVLTLKVKYGDQEEWKEYDLTSHLKDVSVPTALPSLFERIMTCGLYAPLPRTTPAPEQKAKKISTGALVSTVEEITDFLFEHGFNTEEDFDDDGVVITVSRDGDFYIDKYVYLEFKYLGKPDEDIDRIVLTDGSQETLSEKLNAGDFPASNCETAAELLEALEESFSEWKQSMEKFQ